MAGLHHRASPAMDASDVPHVPNRSWEGSPPSRDRKLKKSFLHSTLTSFVRQYPHHSNGKHELRMEHNAGDSRPPTAGSGREKMKAASVDTAIRITEDDDSAEPQTSSSDAEGPNEPIVEDFQQRYPTHPAYAQSTGIGYHARAPPQDPAPPLSPDFSDFDDGRSQYSKRGMHIPTRTSSNTNTTPQPQSRSQSKPTRSTTGRKQSIPDDVSTSASPDTMPSRGFGPGDRSSAESVFSQDTSGTGATSIHALPPLQTKGPENSDAQYLEPIGEDDPRSFDLVAPHEDEGVGMYALERRAEQMLGSEHLHAIFEDPKLLLKFTGFLNSHRPQSIPILIYYLDALKAIRAIAYANAIAEALEPIKSHDFTEQVAKPTINAELAKKANHAFEVLTREDLPAYIAHSWIQVVSVSIQRRITGTLAPHLREASEGLAEVFCLTDPSRPDNPIVFASEEFARTTQYGMSYTIGRNCRFLQGPKTNPNSVRRLAKACQMGKEHSEVFVNYRRDGSPFMNLLMIAPLMDSRGTIRYFIGAQVDVSGLIKDCSDLDGLAHLVEKQQYYEETGEDPEDSKKDEFQELSEMFNGPELETVRRSGGRMHKEYVDESDAESLSQRRRRVLLKDPTQDALDMRRESMATSLGSKARALKTERINGLLQGVYQHYLLVRPAPSLRILFTSPSLRVPGILQSPFLNRVGGSSRVRSDLSAALGEGRGVTAKIRWLTKADEEGEGEGRPRWIHCTPLLGHSGAVGVWMIVLVDEEGSDGYMGTGRRFRAAPPVASNIGGKEWDGKLAQMPPSKERKHMNAYDKESDRKGGASVRSYNLEPELRQPTTGNRTHNGNGRAGTAHIASQQTRGRSAHAAHAAHGFPLGGSHTQLPSAGGNSVDASEFSFGIQTPSAEKSNGAQRGVVY